MIRTAEELERLVTERAVIEAEAYEDMDPLEYAVRKVLPIPAHYYWEMALSAEELERIRPGVKRWHRTIAALDRVQVFLDRTIAQPVASTLGLTESRFANVTDSMSEEEWKISKRNVLAQRQQPQHEKPAASIPSTSSAFTKQDGEAHDGNAI
jgi:hypothetical protein